ncbi:MAG: hypothetical protein ACLRQT_05210 [Alistipes sp.]
MKRTAILLAALALWCGAAAQQTQPPRFQGADAKRFMARLMGETEKLAIEKQIPASELSPQVVVAFTVDTAGRVTGGVSWTIPVRGATNAMPSPRRSVRSSS